MRQPAEGFLLLVVVFLSAPVWCQCTFTHSLRLRWFFLGEASVAEALNRVLPQLKSTNDHELTDKAHRYLQDQSRVSSALDRHLSDWSVVDLAQVGEDLPYQENLDFLDAVTGDPLQVFRLLRRTSAGGDLDVLAKKLNTSASSVLKNDVRMATMAVARIQHVYRKDSFAMASQGQLPTTAQGSVQELALAQSKARLSAEDAMYVADCLLDSDLNKRVYIGMPTMYQYAAAILWYEAALRLSLLESNADMAERTLQHLVDIWKLHDRDFQAAGQENGPTYHLSEGFFSQRLIPRESWDERGVDVAIRRRYQDLLEDPEGDHRMPGAELWSEEEKEPFASWRSDPADPNWSWHRDFFSLCRGGEVNQDQKIQPAEQYCMLSDMGHPYLKIGPFKMEILLPAPDPVHVFHDFVSKEEIEAMRTAVYPRLATSRVQSGTQTDTRMESVERTANTGWIGEGELDPTLPGISLRMEMATGLSVVRRKRDILPQGHDLGVDESRLPYESESYQVGIYNPGGLYLPHTDTGTQLGASEGVYAYNGDWIGSRVATAMLYLNGDADLLGGGTAFPLRNVVAFPSGGALIYWNNLSAEGEVDRGSLHGGCPVIRGIKWVANKWILEGCQLFNRPCGLGKKTGSSAA